MFSENVQKIFKMLPIVILATFVASGLAFPQRQARVIGLVDENQVVENEPPLPYSFAFAVNDDVETNYQQRTEKSDGNVIRGSYSVVDPDGFIRRVVYTADPENGFQADVVREPTDIVVKVPPIPQEQSLNQGLDIRSSNKAPRRELLLAADTVNANGGKQFKVLRKLTPEQARQLGIQL